jgi:O-antigen ligase
MSSLPSLTTTRPSRWLPWAALAAGGLAVLPLTLRPMLGILLLAVAVVCSTASISVAVPLGLTGFAPPIVSLVGHDPFPSKAVPLITFTWIVLAVVLMRSRTTPAPLRPALASPLVLFSAGLFALMLARLPASTDSAYGSFKLQLFVISNMTLLAAGILLGTRRAEIDLYLMLTLGVDALSGALVLQRFGLSRTGPTDRFGLPEQNVIALGIQGAQGLMIATYFITRAKRRWQQIVATCLLPVTLVALLASGSRGPVLGGAAGLLVLLVLLARSHGAALRIALLTLLAVASFMVAVRLVPSAAVERSLSTISGTKSGLASNGRNKLWSAGWTTFADHPALGVGTGSFATVARREVCPGPGCRDRYPHNILLEAGAELGILGLSFVVGILFVGAHGILRAYQRDPLGPASIVFATFTASTVTAMLTGDLAGAGGIWLTGGIGVGLMISAHGATQVRASS